jgi:hypothetical protein
VYQDYVLGNDETVSCTKTKVEIVSEIVSEIVNENRSCCIYQAVEER